MSTSAERGRAARASGGSADEGFTLIEIIVAIGIIGVVMTALLPQLVVGIRSTGTARLVSQAKGVAQGEIDHMRNLPWHVAPDNATADHKYYDIFDTYYPDVVVPTGSVSCTAGGAYAVPQETWSGYVDGGTRCPYEPSGPMYRKVLKRTNPGFMVVVDTQFLSGSGDGSPIAPDTGYDTAAAGSDSPYSTRVGITINVLYADRATNRPVSTYTEIAQQQQSETRLEANVDATAVQLSSIDPVDGSVSLSLGALHLRGALANTSTANATVAAASASEATGTQGLGASATVTAPVTPALPDSVTSPLPAGSLGATCEWACWASSSVAVPTVDSANGLPNAGSDATPVDALITDLTDDGFRFDNPTNTFRLSDLDMVDGAPVVRMDDQATPAALALANDCTPIAGDPSAYIGASGFVRSTAVAASGQEVRACGRTASGVIQLFPTTFAPYGVVQLQLVSSNVSCSVVSGGAVTPTSSFSAIVRIHDPSKEPSDGSHSRDAYTEVDVSSTQTADPLANKLTTDVGGQHQLGHYLVSLSSPTADDIDAANADGQSTLDLPGAVSVATQPTRKGVVVDAVTGDRSASADTDLNSGVALTLGAASCSAKDQR